MIKRVFSYPLVIHWLSTFLSHFRVSLWYTLGMNIAAIILILQLALSLLSSVQMTPNLPEEIRQQAIDFSRQAVELATDAITSLAVNPVDESGRVLGSAPLAPVPPVAQVHIPTSEEFPVGIFTINGDNVPINRSEFVDRSNKNIFFVRQTIPNGAMDFSWNISQKDSNTLNCSVKSEEQTISNAHQGNAHMIFDKYKNITIVCSDPVSNSNSSFYIEIIR